MTMLRKIAQLYLAIVFVVGLAANLVAPHDYAAQFRSHTSEPPSFRFVLGTDDLGRDRFSRLLFATRVSLLTAPATAAATVCLVASLGLLAGWRQGWIDGGIMLVSDLFLSLPLLFLVLTLRALLPLNVGPAMSLAALATVFVVAGWPTGTRVIRAVVMGLRRSPSVVHARAYGCGPLRLFCIHVLPRMRVPLAVQFWMLVPIFLIAEANLGILGLGVSEPLPSLGNLIAELRDYERIPEAPWILAPAALLISILTSLHALLSDGDR